MQNIFLLTYAVVALSLFSAAAGSKTINLLDNLTPADIPPYLDKKEIKPELQRLAKINERELARDERRPVGMKTPVVGDGSHDYIYTDRYDKGLFSTIFKAYANHWVLVTTPEDWWFTIIRKVALDIDAVSDNQTIRNFFVSHEGKKELVVELGTSVYGANYSNFFDAMTDKIAENINKPEYVKIMNSDFSTSSNLDKIVSNLAIMSSVQEYFSYSGGILCGIPKVEMKGTEQDWVRLLKKFNKLEKYLQELQNIIGNTKWWPKARTVLEKLLDTYRDNPDQDWWSKIITQSGAGGCGIPQEFTGWFVDILQSGQPDELAFSRVTPDNLPSGLISVPMKITDGNTEEQSALVAGIPGFTIEKDEKETKIQAVHAWALMMEPNSVFRNELEN
eukprot:GFUD01001412.1.p1 GENE.GFUD01001412.1~~GFUD01001412.1.p1  ORF type:complete len:391 (+),score=103.74 GFUD01001412.1:353-1525(+)